VDGMSDRLQQMVRVAQDEVNDMRARATRGAAQILSMAQAEADELVDGSRQQRREFEAEQHQAQDELRVRLEESRTRLAQMREEADGQRARLDAELAERRSREEQSLASDIAERRDVLMTELGAQEKRQREEAQRIVDAASTEARAVLAEAAAEAERSRSQLRDHVSRGQEELEQLRALQHQIAEQLTGVRSLLDWTLPRVTAPAPTPTSATTLSATPPQAQPAFAPSTVAAMPPAAAALPPPTATLAARSFDDLSPAYADAFDDTEMNAPADAAPDDAFDATIATESETTEATAQRFTGPGFPSTEDVRGDDVPEPRTTADDEPERPSPVARPERPSRLSARISSRR
jgi:hypothetical protein